MTPWSCFDEVLRSGAVRSLCRLSLSMALCACAALPAGCSYDTIDYLYEDARRFGYSLALVEADKVLPLYPDLVKKEDYTGQYLNVETLRLIARRKLEKNLVVFLKGKCAAETFSCAMAELKRLGFHCVETGNRAACTSERRTWDPSMVDPLKGDGEVQLWTVLLEPDAEGAAIEARIKFLGRLY